MMSRSPVDLREGLESESLEPYQPPRMLTRQAKFDQHPHHNDDLPPVANNINQSNNVKNASTRRTWLSRLSSGSKTNEPQENSFRNKLSKRIARLSSLDSTRSSSSVEDQLSAGNATQAPPPPPPPIISITQNDDATSEKAPAVPSASQRRADYYRDYYGRARSRGGHDSPRVRARTNRTNYDEDDEDDDDDDAFDDSPLPMPYSSSSMARTVVVRQQTDRGVSYPTSSSSGRNIYAELLDDRQGMNDDSEQQFTKAEKQSATGQWPSSIDEGSVVGVDFRVALKNKQQVNRLQQVGGSQKRDKRGRSKSPMWGKSARRQSSRRGFLGLASRLKLTKKHESIARLQLSILNSRFVSLKTLDRDLQSFLPKERQTIREFQERVKLMRKFEVLSTLEYRFASKYETYVCKHAQQESNQAKNSYKKCIPYDYNRVVLKTLPNVPDSDYINASHVDSCLKPNAYIAAQGPNEVTIEDFWRMIWEQKTFVIVMLTKVFDFIRVMCNQYWPVELNKPERYGNIEVTLLYEEPLADFVIRTIRIVKLKGDATATTPATPNIDQPNPLSSLSVQEKVNELEAQEEQDDDDQDQDQYSEDDDEQDTLFQFPAQYLRHSGEFISAPANNSLAVRAPRYVTSGRRRRARERSLPPGERQGSDANQLRRASSQLELASSKLELADQKNRSASAMGSTSAAQPPPRRPNEFLHPLFSPTSSLSLNQSTQLAGSGGSPLATTPRTPSSAGLDRSSATRRAVKKKRRERVRDQRPRRTQFMVPTESQLQDDDDDDDDELDGGGGGGGAEDAEPEVAPATEPKRPNERIIYQFHYNSWHSHTCPFISSLLHFRRRVRICMDEMSKSGKTGCTVVHCNDGCGRTGAFLCIDANLELAEEDNVLDIYNYTRKMRQSRKFLIENLEQYKFVYDTIEEALYCGKTWFPVSELHKRLKHKSQRNPLTRKNEYLVEYEKICQMTSRFSIGDCAGGHRVENREKNRDVSTVPPDNFRPYLTSFQTNDSTDYINAVFIDGYTRSKEYIVTEWPLHRTISDFWSLVYDHDCNSVILLANPGESSTYPSFLPSEKELIRKFGPVFQAEMVSYTHYQNIKSWIYTIDKKKLSLTEIMAGVKRETKTTQVFQITCWPQGHRVPTSTNALVELMNMVERWRQRTTYGPVCVVSLDGKSRAGVYCAANVAIEQVVQHSEVDVFNAVKTVRRHRPQLIENMTEYKYCYDLILHYVIHYVNNPSASGQ